MRGGRTRRPPQVALRDRRTGPELAGGRPRRHGVPQPGRKRFVRPGGAPSFKKTTPAGRIPTPARLARASSSCRACVGAGSSARSTTVFTLWTPPTAASSGRRRRATRSSPRPRWPRTAPRCAAAERELGETTKTNARRPEQHASSAQVRRLERRPPLRPQRGRRARPVDLRDGIARPIVAIRGGRRHRVLWELRPLRVPSPRRYFSDVSRRRRGRDRGDAAIPRPRRERAGLFATRPPRRYALNPDGSLKWRAQTLSWVESSPAVGDDGVVYVGSDDSYLYALNPDDGSVEWQFATSCAPARVSLDVRRVLSDSPRTRRRRDARYGGRRDSSPYPSARGSGLSVRGRGGGAATRLLYPRARGPRTLRARPRPRRDYSCSVLEGS